MLIGAAATYLLTNETVQSTAIKGVVKVWSMLRGGIEEVKERFHDAEAELHADESAKEE
jgi:translation initiation factor 2 alpha subunit (eIF-2alpha)